MAAKKKQSPEEDRLYELCAQDDNLTCPNCGTYSQWGYKNICVPFKTFVCGDCKAAHQAYSHRIKSIAMSNWTMQEVEVLATERGGGNRLAAASWMARLSETDRTRIMPRKGDNQDKFKEFIRLVYCEKRFYAEGGSAATATAPPAASSATSTPTKRRAAPSDAPASPSLSGSLAGPSSGVTLAMPTTADHPRSASAPPRDSSRLATPTTPVANSRSQQSTPRAETQSQPRVDLLGGDLGGLAPPVNFGAPPPSAMNTTPAKAKDPFADLFGGSLGVQTGSPAPSPMGAQSSGFVTPTSAPAASNSTWFAPAPAATTPSGTGFGAFGAPASAPPAFARGDSFGAFTAAPQTAAPASSWGAPVQQWGAPVQQWGTQTNAVGSAWGTPAATAPQASAWGSLPVAGPPQAAPMAAPAPPGAFSSILEPDRPGQPANRTTPKKAATGDPFAGLTQLSLNS